jgi:hypothetical protein
MEIHKKIKKIIDYESIEHEEHQENKRKIFKKQIKKMR